LHAAQPESFFLKSSLDYASGTATRNGTSIDTQGLEWVLFVWKFAAIAASAVTTVKVQQSSDNSSFADLAGTEQTVANDDDNQIFATLIKRPGKRYLRPVVVKDSSNAAAEMAFMIGGGGGGPNLAAVTDLITLEAFVAPAEGTA
jgi:hypothetical protein